MLTYFEGKSQIVMQQNYGRKMYATELLSAYLNDEAKINKNHVNIFSGQSTSANRRKAALMQIFFYNCCCR
jgi:hypothetical protein